MKKDKILAGSKPSKIKALEKKMEQNLAGVAIQTEMVFEVEVEKEINGVQKFMTKIINISYTEKDGYYTTTGSDLKGLVVIQSSLSKFAKGLEDSIKALYIANEGKRVDVREISNDNDNLGQIRYEVVSLSDCSLNGLI